MRKRSGRKKLAFLLAFLVMAAAVSNAGFAVYAEDQAENFNNESTAPADEVKEDVTDVDMLPSPEELPVEEDIVQEKVKLEEDGPEKPEAEKNIPEEPETTESVPETMEDVPEKPEVTKDIPEKPEAMENAPEKLEVSEDISGILENLDKDPADAENPEKPDSEPYVVQGAKKVMKIAALEPESENGPGDEPEPEPAALQENEPAAKIGEQEYDSLASAVAAAQNGDIITLLKDVDAGGKYILINKKSVTLDLNGYTVQGSGEYVLAVANTTAAIQAGTVKGGTGAAVYVQNATVNLDRVTVEGQQTGIKLGIGNGKSPGSTYHGSAVISNSSISGNTTGILVIGTDGVTKETSSLGVFDSVISGGRYGISGNGSWDGTDITLNTGTVVTSSEVGIYHPQQGSLTIHRGAQVSGRVALQICGGSALIDGATLTSSDAEYKESPYKDAADADGRILDGAAVSVVSRKNYGEITVEIRDGSFVTKAGNDAVKLYGYGKDNGEWDIVDPLPERATVRISGGSFSTSIPDGFCEEGYRSLQVGADRYIVTQAEGAVQVVGDKTYLSIKEAVDAVRALGGTGTVRLLVDLEESVTIPEGVDITLDLNGKKLTNTPGAKNVHTITNKGKITITGEGVVDNVSHASAALYNKGTAVIAGGTFTRSQENGHIDESGKRVNGGNSWYVVYNGGTMAINGGEIRGTSEFSSLVCNGSNSEAGTMAISGGKLFQEKYTALISYPMSTLTITGNADIGVSRGNAVVLYGTAAMDSGKVHGGNFTAFNAYTDTGVKVTGGEIDCEHIWSVCFSDITTIAGKDCKNGKTTITISGNAAVNGQLQAGKYNNGTGTFHDQDQTENAKIIVVPSDNPGQIVSFDRKVPGQYCEKGYRPSEKMENGRYTVEKDIPARYSVIYSWSGLPENTVFYDEAGNVATIICPASITGLVKGQSYTIDTASPGTVVYTHDADGNINGRYTLGAWNAPATGIMGDGDVTVSAVWSYTALEVPVAPSEPETPEDPSGPAAPETPEDPSGPAAPETPEDPSEPAAPETPEDPSEPTTPVRPEDPSEPATPAEPEGSSDPTTPVVPENPSGPTTPINPAAPANPGTSGAGTAPTIPAGTGTPIVPGTPGAGALTPQAAAPSPGETLADAEEERETADIAEGQVPLAASIGQDEEESEKAEITSQEEGAVKVIGEEDVPLAKNAAMETWALINLILTIFTTALSLLLLTGCIAGKRKEERGKWSGKGMLGLLSLAPAAAAVIVFVMTADLKSKMVFADRWTLPILAFAVMNGILAVFAARKAKEI